MTKLVECVEEETFVSGHQIIRQGDQGDLFYILRSGKCRVTINQKDGKEREVSQLSRGDFFGERALVKKEVRAANVYAISDVVLYSLERDHFVQLIGHLDNLANVHDKELQIKEEVKRVINPLVRRVGLKDLKIVKVIGKGSFGPIKMVKVPGISHQGFVLKLFKKIKVVKENYQPHMLEEKKLLQSINSPFITCLLRTFRDSRMVSFLTDAYLGGDLLSLLVRKGPFS
jgi:cGMP-dependent protein kinase